MSTLITPPPLPHWATRKGQAHDMRKRQVLKFLFQYAALLHGNRTTIRMLSADCGYHETAINTAIMQNAVSEEMAQAVATSAGTKLFDPSWLTDPEALM